MTQRITLTDPQLNALTVLSGLDHPTLMDWASGMGVTVTATQYHKNILKKHGLVESTPGKSRSTRLTDAGKMYLKRQAKR